MSDPATLCILALPFAFAILLAVLELLPGFVRKTAPVLVDRVAEKKARRKPGHARGRTWPLTTPRAPKATDEERPKTVTYGTFADFDGAQTAALLEDLNLGQPFNVTMPKYFASDKLSGSGMELPSGWREEYTHIRNLPGGAEGEVRIIENARSGKLFVVKTIDAASRDDGYYELPGEARALACYVQKHNNIVDFAGYGLYFAKNSYPVCDLLLEYCAGGDMLSFSNHWRSMRRYVPPMFVMHFIASMSDALAWLHHGHGPLYDLNDGDGSLTYEEVRRPDPIIHQDIKLENIFLRWGPNNKHGMPDIVVGDFGFAVPAPQSKGIYGTPGYHPPEAKAVVELKHSNRSRYRYLLGRQTLTKAGDVYTFGAALYILVTNRTFDNREFDHIPPDLEQDFAHCPLADMPSMLRMLRECLAKDPLDRVPTRDLWLSAMNFKDTIAALYERGERMPDYAFDYDNPSPHPVIAAEAEAAAQAAAAEAAAGVRPPPSEGMGNPRPPVSAAPVQQTDRMSQVSGFSDDFCWCPNHRSISLREPRSNCVRKRERSYGERSYGERSYGERSYGERSPIDQQMWENDAMVIA